MNKTDDILDRLQQAQQPRLDAPDELTERVMASVPKRGANKDKSTRTLTVKFFKQSTAAACLLILFGVGATLLFNTKEACVQPIVQQQTKPEMIVCDTTKKTAEGIILQMATVSTKKDSNTIQKHRAKEFEATGYPDAIVKDENMHYTSLELKDSDYQAPCRVDEFITKLAEYNKIKPMAVKCAGDSTDSHTAGLAYVFPDRQEIDLFGRLLLVAVSYNQQTPGYKLNISNNQLVFQLHDKREKKKYLWMVERISGQRILLYTTQSPSNAPLSTACYLEFRDELTHTGNAYQLI